jgi:uncharacterized protein (DUF488 family)
MATIYTVGHGARSAVELLSILKEAGIETLVDVRAGCSRSSGIAYDWQGEALGGFRKCGHRSHIADWLVGHGHRVVHLLAQGRSREHAVHPQEDLWRDV